MEKIINIDCKNVKFKTNGALLFLYKAQFRRDAMKDIMAIRSAIGDDGEVDAEKLDFEVFFNLAWTMAKIADKNIDPPMEWLSSFDEFPILDILPDIFELLESALSTSKKK